MCNLQSFDILLSTFRNENVTSVQQWHKQWHIIECICNQFEFAFCKCSSRHYRHSRHMPMAWVSKGARNSRSLGWVITLTTVTTEVSNDWRSRTVSVSYFLMSTHLGFWCLEAFISIGAPPRFGKMPNSMSFKIMIMIKIMVWEVGGRPYQTNYLRRFLPFLSFCRFFFLPFSFLSFPANFVAKWLPEFLYFLTLMKCCLLHKKILNVSTSLKCDQGSGITPNAFTVHVGGVWNEQLLACRLFTLSAAISNSRWYLLLRSAIVRGVSPSLFTALTSTNSLRSNICRALGFPPFGLEAARCSGVWLPAVREFTSAPRLISFDITSACPQ